MSGNGAPRISNADAAGISHGLHRLIEAPNIAEFLAVWLEEHLLPDEEQSTLNRYYAGYRAYFPNRMRFFYAAQTREVEALIRRMGRPRLLEVGCGCGTESLWFSLVGARVTALDVRSDRFATARARQAVLERAAGRKMDLEFVLDSVLSLRPAEPFDIVWMEQAFHHLEPREDVVRRLGSLIRPGGYLVISEANGLNPLLQLQLLRRRGLRTVSTIKDAGGREIPYGNERVLSARSLVRLLGRNGFVRESVSHFRLFPNLPVFGRLSGFERAVAGRLLARPMATHYNYVGRRSE